MNHIESYIDKKDAIKSIRAIELRFDKILIKNTKEFLLYQDGIYVATINGDCLIDKARSKLESLAD